MQTLIDIEEQQLNKLLFYTHAKNGTEAITQIIQDYLSQKDKLNNQLVVMQKKRDKMRYIGCAEVRSASFELTRMMCLLSSAHPISLYL